MSIKVAGYFVAKEFEGKNIGHKDKYTMWKISVKRTFGHRDIIKQIVKININEEDIKETYNGKPIMTSYDEILAL